MSLTFDKFTFEGHEIQMPNVSAFPLSNAPYLLEHQFVSFLVRALQPIRHRFPFAVCEDMSFPSIQDNFLHLNLTTFKIGISNNLISYINNYCSSKQLVIIPVKIVLVAEKVQSDVELSVDDFLNENIDDIMKTVFHNTKVHIAHSNVIIIDNLNKTIEFFEPHGFTMDHTIARIIDISSLLTRFMKTFIPLSSNYTFKNVSNSCFISVQSLQTIVDPSVGHCLAWSLLFILLRIVNLNLKPTSKKSVLETINEFLVSFSPIYLDTYIKQFLSCVERLPPLPMAITNTIEINVIPWIQESEEAQQVKNRLRKLIKDYFKQLLSSNTFMNTMILFEEISSYRNFYFFNRIMSDEFLTFLTENEEEIKLQTVFMKLLQ